MSLHIIQSDGSTLAIAGELTDADAPEFASALDGLKRSVGIPTIDLSAVGQVSARCIGALVAAWVDLIAAERWFELRASDATWQRLGAAGIARVFFHRPSSAAEAGPLSRAALFSGSAGSLAPKPPASPRDDASTNAEIDRYLERIAALEGELALARERENTAVSERNDQGITLRGKAQEIAQLRSEVEGARADDEKSRGMATELEAARGQLAELDGTRQRVSELEGLAETLGAKERSLTAELAAARAENADLQEAISNSARKPSAKRVKKKTARKVTRGAKKAGKAAVKKVSKKVSKKSVKKVSKKKTSKKKARKKKVCKKKVRKKR